MLSVSFLVRLKHILFSANALRVVFDLRFGELSRKPQKLAKTISAFSGFLSNLTSFHRGMQKELYDKFVLTRKQPLLIF